MRRLLAILGLCGLIGASAAEDAGAKLAAGYVVQGGATVSGSPFRYSAMSPGSARPSARHRDSVTVVAQTARSGGRVTRWWHVPGGYYIPAAAHDDAAGGLSADGGTLVLAQLSRVYPPPRTKFAVLDTSFHLHPRGGGARHPIRRLGVPGHFSFDAISPDGSKLYLIQHLDPRRPLRYAVRALDLNSGRLLPEPVVDPSEPDERMAGLPLSRESSPDGRWAYTLYAAHNQEPFVHALDTVAGTAVCVDLPQLAGLHRRFFYLLHLRIAAGGRELVVMRHRPGPPKARPLLAVDTGSFEVDGRVAAAGAQPQEAGFPWLPIGGLGALLGVGFALVLSARRGTGERWRHR